MLLAIPRGVMGFTHGVHQYKRIAKFISQRIGTVPHHIEIAATGWAIGREGSDDHMTAEGDCVTHSLDVASTLRRAGEKVKHGPIVPDINAGVGQLNWELRLGHIGHHPIYPRCMRA